jgi:hypothetical protein
VAFLIGMGLAAALLARVEPQHAYALAGGALLIATIFAAQAAMSNQRADQAELERVSPS